MQNSFSRIITAALAITAWIWFNFYLIMDLYKQALAEGRTDITGTISGSILVGVISAGILAMFLFWLSDE